MAPKTKSKKGAAADGARATQDVPKPNWPVFAPLLPPSDLSLESLVPGQVVVIRNFWTSKLCKDYVSFLSSLPLVTTPGKPKKGDAVRVNDRLQIDDPQFARRLWSETALESLVSQAGDVGGEGVQQSATTASWGGQLLGLNSNVRIYRYSKGQFFDQHYDDANTVTHSDPVTGATVPAKTTWTLLLYLTSATNGCRGGETVFYPEPSSKAKNAPTPDPVVVELETGMALLHKHGKDCMLHEGREVLEGEKWVIRSDLCIRR